MKKLLFIAGIAAVCAGYADETVTGTTEVGMLEIRSAAKNAIVAVPFLEMTGGDICVSNIVKTANLEAGDELYVFGGTRGSWTAWVLTSSGGTNPYLYWKSVGAATIGSDGKPTYGETPEANVTKLATGSAIWLTRENPSSDTPFYVYGGYTSGLTTTVAANTKTLVANPTASKVTDITTKISAATGDTIWVLGDDGSATTQYIYNSGWYVKNGRTYTAAADPTLAPGCGVWMQLKHAATINW